jgi:rSAM/selenodomain-associated transferase 1
MKSQNHFGLFAKYWQPGRVKTRLASTVGDVAAAAVYRELLKFLVDQLAAVGDHRTIVFTPANRQAEFLRLRSSGWDLTAQAAGDLGERMKSFCQHRMIDRQLGNRGEPKVVVIGSDCPTVDSKTVENAFELLDDRPVVLGPCVDGGYFLLGIRGDDLDLYSGIDWSTDRVLRQTIEKLESRRIEYSLLPEMEDIDDRESLNRFLTKVQSSCSGWFRSPVVKSLHVKLSSILAVAEKGS